MGKFLTGGGPSITLNGTTVLVTGGAPDWHGRPVCCVQDGVVIMVYYSSSAHAVNDGALHIKFSDDYGDTWTAEDTYLDGNPVTNFPMNPPDCELGQDATEPRIMIAPNGDLLLHMWRQDFDGPNYDGTYQSVSSDGGATWSVAAAIDITGTTNDSNMFCTDDYFVYDSVVYAGGRDFTSGARNMLIKSTDNGVSWALVGYITASGTTEVGLEYLGSNHIVATLRDSGNAKTYQADSYDMGVNWIAYEITAHLPALGRPRIYTQAHLEGGDNWWADDNLIMCGFEFDSGQRRNCVWFSTDSGVSWYPPKYLDDLYDDGGYGDLFYNPTSGEYVFLCYRGIGDGTDDAQIVQYNFTVDWAA